MVNEAVNPIELHGNNKGGVVSYSCMDGVAIAKGALLVLDTETGKIRFVSGSSSVHVTGAYTPIGIASSEKKVLDGQVTIGVWTKGIFDLKLNTDTCAIGDKITVSGANMVGPVHTGENSIGSDKTSLVLGTTLEAGTTGATVAVKVDC